MENATFSPVMIWQIVELTFCASVSTSLQVYCKITKNNLNYIL